MAEERCCTASFWGYLMISVGLVSFAGLMSGLTLGLMSLSLVDLEVLIKAGQPKDRLHAAKILPVVKNQHLLLCTLLIGNSLAMEALPIFLDALVPAWGAILISVTLILTFGEIIPQALCTRYGLSVGAKTAPIVRVLLLIFFPVAYPISKICRYVNQELTGAAEYQWVKKALMRELLDWVLGKGHVALMRRAELKTLVDMHGNEAGKGGELTHDETTIIAGALELTQKSAEDAMTKISETFSLDINSKLDMYTMNLIMTKGHSRVPIYSGSPTNIIGLILVKNLITFRPEDEVPIRNVTIRRIPRVYCDLPLYDILNEFQKGHSHMAVVVKRVKDSGMQTENSKNSMLESRTNWTSGQNHQDVPGDESQSVFAEQLGSFTTAPLMNINIHGPQSPLKRSKEKQGDTRSPLKKSDRGRHNILDVNSDSLPSYSLDEEVVGIITMEDVMEELLQEEILDETDEYVDVHNKIKINMLPPRKSPKSPGTAPISQLPRRTPSTSPLSPYYNTTIQNLRVSPLTQTPGPTSNILTSAGRSLLNSPADQFGPVPASHQTPEKNEE